MKRERRFIEAKELRTEIVDGKRFISGYAAKFNKKSEDLGGFREIIKPGAFARSIREKADVRCLFNHDANMILGRTEADTLSIAEDEIGLHFRCELPDTSYARDLDVSIGRRDISQCSFGFFTREQSWVESKDETTRELHDVDLFDTSPVTFPAYTDTEVHASSVGIELRALIFPDGLPEDVEKHSKKTAPPIDFPDKLDTLRRAARGKWVTMSLTE